MLTVQSLQVREYTFYDLFEAAEPDAKSKKCPHGYTSINQYGIGQECLKLKKGMYKYASRFETRRFAAPAVTSAYACAHCVA